jgi:predicted TIM-barrel enzyme
MAKRISREEILDRIKKSVAANKPLFVATSATGLIAKCAEIGGADFIFAAGTSLNRQKGLPSLAPQEERQNDLILKALDDLAFVIEDIPIIAAIEANVKGDLNEIVAEFNKKPISAVLNFPCVGGQFAHRGNHQSKPRTGEGTNKKYADLFNEASQHLWDRGKAELGDAFSYEREVEMLKIAKAQGLFTFCFAWSPEQAGMMAEAGIDVIAAHCGGTRGGLLGAPDEVSYEAAAEKINTILDGAKKVNKDVILFAHGGPFSSPKDTEAMFRLTDAVGFIAGSAIDRIPIETAVINATREFKNVSLRR